MLQKVRRRKLFHNIFMVLTFSNIAVSLILAPGIINSRTSYWWLGFLYPLITAGSAAYVINRDINRECKAQKRLHYLQSELPLGVELPSVQDIKFANLLNYQFEQAVETLAIQENLFHDINKNVVMIVLLQHENF